MKNYCLKKINAILQMIIKLISCEIDGTVVKNYVGINETSNNLEKLWVTHWPRRKSL